ncbi:MAG TPA: HAD family hydrolase [Candidatus Limnocylindria bacterium]|nr:HAD family hydrolase [Candidatus Limnocylindria bacterium]
MRYELIIFDCDGVLVDSERIAIRIESEGLTALGWRLSQEEVIERFVGRSAAYGHAEIVAKLGSAVAESWSSEFRRMYRAALETDVAAVEGVVEALDRIDTLTCVASSSDHEHLRLVLGRTGLYPRFHGRVFSGTDVQNGKPAPDLFLHVAASLGVAPSSCAVIEDSLPGILAAQAAGMGAYAYLGGVTPHDRLRLPGVIPIAHMRDLPDKLRSRQ